MIEEHIQIQYNALVDRYGAQINITFDQFKAITLDVLPPGTRSSDNDRDKETG